MPTWYYGRLEEIPPGIDWSEVRAHVFARAIYDHVCFGIRDRPFSPVLFDPRFFPWQFAERGCVLTHQELRGLLNWATPLWPDYSLQDFNIWSIVTWLEVLNPTDAFKTLQILETRYGHTK
jgi:hypothetical protein